MLLVYGSVQSGVITVSEYSALLTRALKAVGSAVIEGEVRSVHVTGGGMLFFDLSDGESQLSCKIFKGDAARLEHRPAAGDLVQVQVDRPDFYAARGSVALIVSGVRLAGEGELLRRRAQLIERLTAEGLCDHSRWRTLPRFPRAVGVIAGKDSDGMSDVIKALGDRWPAVEIVICPSLVQGQSAPAALIDALARLQDEPNVDVIVMARGGGSVSDLVCFDDERLCRALFACEVPVVCAIGHTDNNPVCNHVTWSAFTPSRSAEMVVPSARELAGEIAAMGERVAAVDTRLELLTERIGGIVERADCGLRLTTLAERIGELGGRMAEGAARRLDDAERDSAHLLALIEARDFRPRGWLLASTANGAPVRSITDLAVGAEINLELRDGAASAVVEAIRHQQGSDSQ